MDDPLRQLLSLSRPGLRGVVMTWMPAGSGDRDAGTQLRGHLTDAVRELEETADQAPFRCAFSTLPDIGRAVLRRSGPESESLIPVVRYLDWLWSETSPHLGDGTVGETPEGFNIVRQFVVDELRAIIYSLTIGTA